MPDIDINGYTAALQHFFLFCAAHPWLAFPIAFVLSVYVIVKLCVSGYELGDKWYRAVGPRRFALTVAILAIGALVLSSLAVALGRSAGKAAPVITTLGGPVLSRDFVLRWQYSSSQNQSVLYDIEVTDKQTGQRHVERTSLPYYHIHEQGDLRIDVKAILADGTTLSSQPISVELYKNSVERIKRKRQLAVAVHTDQRRPLLFSRREVPQIRGL